MHPLRGPNTGYFVGEVPTAVSSFIGRAAELTALRSLLEADRCVTLTGSGGCGKSRLALKLVEQVAERFPDGVVIVDLAPLSTEASVPAALARALDLRDPGYDTIGLIAASLGRKRVLVVLDTCEHVIGACAVLVDEVLRRCPGVSVVATSREPLGVDGETTYRVPSLGVPSADANDVGRFDSIELFVQRARRVRPNFTLDARNAPAIAAICRRLDGVPLAIELAAARTRMMSVEQILAGLDDRFRLLTGGSRTALPRQRTLQASVDWSFALLAEPERVVLRRLAVFPGSFDLDAAEQIAAGGGIEELAVLDLLASLVDKSLVQTADEGRYKLLETMRHFAQGSLAEEPDEAMAVRDRHAEYYRALSGRGPASQGIDGVIEWLDLLDVEYSNFTSAITWAEQSQRPDLLADTAANLAAFARRRGKMAEIRAHLSSAIEHQELAPDLRARAAGAAAEIALEQWDLEAADAFARVALESGRELGDTSAHARALIVRGWVASWTGRPEDAQAHLVEAESLAKEHELGAAHANALYGLAMVPFARADLEASRPLLEQGAAEARTHGELDQLLNNLWNLFLLHWHSGDDAKADAVATEGLDLAARLKDRDHRAIFIGCCALIASRRGALEEARRLVEEARSLAEVSSSPLAHMFVLVVEGMHARDAGELARALDSLGQAGRLFQAVNAALPAANCFSYAAEVACLLGDGDRAGALVQDAETTSALQVEEYAPVGWAQAHLALARSDLDLAEDHAHKALSQAVAKGFVPVALEALELLGVLAVRQDSLTEGARLLGSVEQVRRDRGWVLPRALETVYADPVKAAAGDAAFEQGMSLSLEEAIAYARRGRGERKRPAFGWQSLTPTERRVVELVADGLSNAEVCERLFMSLGTVKAHLRHVYSKVGLSSRIQLAQEFARRRAG